MTFEEWFKTAPEAQFAVGKSPRDYAKAAWEAARKEDQDALREARGRIYDLESQLADERAFVEIEDD